MSCVPGLEKAVGERSCNGSGTSDVADLVGRIYAGKPTYLIVGAPFGVYYVASKYACTYPSINKRPDRG